VGRVRTVMGAEVAPLQLVFFAQWWGTDFRFSNFDFLFLGRRVESIFDLRFSSSWEGQGIDGQPG
jgi:hypothetical protein